MSVPGVVPSPKDSEDRSPNAQNRHAGQEINQDGSKTPQDEGDEPKGNRSSWLDNLQKQVEMKHQEKSGVEEKPKTPLQQLVISTKFTLVTTTVICVNGIIIGIETDHGDGSTGWVAVEIMFLICYLIELAVRLAADGLEPLKKDGWVRFDAFVCAVALIDMCIISPTLQDSGGEAKQLAMVLRIVRLMKLARVVRLLKFFKELWLLVASFGSAFKTLGWTFCLLTMVLYVFSILFVKMLGKDHEDPQINDWFGSMGGAMFSLFQVGVTMDSWSEFVRAVWETDQWFMAIVLVIFMGICSFAIMNTVLAVICEHTLGQAMDVDDDLIKIKEQELHQKAKELAEIFRQADTDRGGTLSRSEFVAALDSTKTRTKLQEMDLGEDFGTLDQDEIGMLFDVIDVDNNQELNPKEFVNGLLQMRGEARARGIFEVHCRVLKIRNSTKKFFAAIVDELLAFTGSPPPPDGPHPLSLAGAPPLPPDAPHSVANDAKVRLEAKLDRGMLQQAQAVAHLENKMQDGIEDISKRLRTITESLCGPGGPGPSSILA